MNRSLAMQALAVLARIPGGLSSEAGYPVRLLANMIKDLERSDVLLA